jgi:hypothetical protein
MFCGIGFEEIQKQCLQRYENGNKFYEEGKFTEAVVEYLEAEKISIKWPENYWALGNAYYQIKDYDNAIVI